MAGDTQRRHLRDPVALAALVAAALEDATPSVGAMVSAAGSREAVAEEAFVVGIADSVAEEEAVSAVQAGTEDLANRTDSEPLLTHQQVQVSVVVVVASEATAATAAALEATVAVSAVTVVTLEAIVVAIVATVAVAAVVTEVTETVMVLAEEVGMTVVAVAHMTTDLAATVTAADSAVTETDVEAVPAPVPTPTTSQSVVTDKIATSTDQETTNLGNVGTREATKIHESYVATDQDYSLVLVVGIFCSPDSLASTTRHLRLSFSL